MSSLINTTWPPAEETQTRRWLAAFYEAVRQEAEQGTLAARGIENRLSAACLVAQAATQAAERYSFLCGILQPGLRLPQQPNELAVTTGLMASEVLELAVLHDELANQAEEHDNALEADRRRARAAQLRTLVGEVRA